MPRLRRTAAPSRGAEDRECSSGNDSNEPTNNESRKRPRLQNEGARNTSTASISNSPSNMSSAACDPCRIRKVRCDRQRPECSNCRKSGIACNQTSNFKRVNHAKQLRDDFSSVLCRLDGIDETLAKLTQQFVERSYPIAGSDSSHEHFNKEPNPCSLSSNTRPSRPRSSRRDNTWPSLVFPNTQDELNQTRHETPRGLRSSTEDEFLTERVKLDQGGQRAYRYPSSMTLLKSISKKITDSCHGADINASENGIYHSETSPAKSMVWRQLDSFPFRGKCAQPVISSDHQPIVAPPQLITRLFIDGFLQDINIRFPIFDERSLRGAVDTYYSSTAHEATGSPWAIIFNNIALLELGLETQVARWQGSLAGTSSIRTSLLTEDLLSSFFLNCDRALADLTPYTRPSLPYIQALLTLALIAQEFYGSTPFERALQTACHVGRMLGLHISASHGRESGENSREQERVFRVLYGMDKQRVFLTGEPCDLYRFDSDLELWAEQLNETKSPSQRPIVAINDMMIIWEEVYLKLYSARAIALGTAHLSSQVPGLMKLLTEWYEHHSGALGTIASRLSFDKVIDELSLPNSLNGQEDDDLAYLRLEATYCYHVTQVLILRCERSGNQAAQTQMRHHARICLRMIIEMGNIEENPLPTPSNVAKARLASLNRVLGTYPIVAFTDLVFSHLDKILSSSPPSATHSVAGEADSFDVDIELLNNVPRLLQTLHHLGRPGAYLNRLRQGLGWAAQVLEETRKAFLVEPQTGEPSNMTMSDSVVGSMAASTSGGCGFYGLDNWQDFFTQGK